MKGLPTPILKIVYGSALVAAGVLMILFFKDFTPRYIGGAIIAAFGAVSIASGIMILAKK